MTDAFLRVNDGAALLLPRLLALADLDSATRTGSTRADIPACAIDPLRAPIDPGPAGDVAAAAFFGGAADRGAAGWPRRWPTLIDEVETEQVDFAKLALNSRPNSAFAETLARQTHRIPCKIVTAHWPGDSGWRRARSTPGPPPCAGARPRAPPIGGSHLPTGRSGDRSGFPRRRPGIGRADGRRCPPALQGSVVLPGLDLRLDN